jgi:diacylglycerol kinase family enzyme
LRGRTQGQYQSSKEKKWKKALKKPGDIVAVAGGDGTVGKVARRLIGSPTPIAILPLGTANNIANTLDVTGKSLKELIRSWKTARCINFDAGVAKGPWGTESFVEGFGVGLFAETMTRLDGSKIIDLAGADDPPTVLRTVLKILRKHLKEHPATEMTIRLDGKEMSGDYVLLEAMNVRYVRPNLDLVPRADINDGLLDVVLVGSGERGKLKPYFSKSKATRANLGSGVHDIYRSSTKALRFISMMHLGRKKRNVPWCNRPPSISRSIPARWFFSLRRKRSGERDVEPKPNPPVIVI